MPTATAVPTATTAPMMVLCMQPVAFGQDLLLFNAAAGASPNTPLFTTTVAA